LIAVVAGVGSEGAVVPGGVGERLTLDGEFFENLARVVVNAVVPGGADLVGERNASGRCGDCSEDAVGLVTFVDDDGVDARSHGDGHFDVKAHFADVCRIA
jgi:hypothetical protein